MPKGQLIRLQPLMTAEQFNQALADMNLTPAAFSRVILNLSGQEVAYTTIYRWTTGRTDIPPLAIAFVRLLELLPRTKRDKLILK